MKRAGGMVAAALPLLAMLAPLAAGCSASEAASDSADLTSKGATVESTVDLDVVEASGLGARTVDGDLQLLAVGDHATDLALAGDPESFDSIDLSDSVDLPSGASQWEAVAGDSAGNVVLLRESPPSLFVLDADLELVAEVALHVDDDLDIDWDEDSNGLAEGLVLLANGHVLVAKEKDPPALIELGPAGDEASGFATGDAATTFSVPGTDTFEALHVWPLSSSAEAVAPDVSDLAVDPSGALYLLSDEGRAIGRVEDNLGADEDHAKLTASWKLPKKVKKAEGLLFLPDGTPLVAVDSSSSNKNGFVLAPLD